MQRQLPLHTYTNDHPTRLKCRERNTPALDKRLTLTCDAESVKKIYIPPQSAKTAVPCLYAFPATVGKNNNNKNVASGKKVGKNKIMKEECGRS